MNTLPMGALSPKQQRQLYAMLGRQAQSYRKGSTSLPAETARELLESILYTLGHAPAETDLDAALKLGQNVLADKLDRAQQLARLVAATAPAEQSQCQWECVAALSRYLEGYDLHHMAHRVPQDLFYPLLRPVPEGLLGIDCCLYILNCLWAENQILAAFPQGAVAELYSHLPPDYWEAPQNLCEQPLWNGVAKMLLGLSPVPLWMDDPQRERVASLLQCQERPQLLADSLDALCRVLSLPESAAAYAAGTLPDLNARLSAALPGGDLHFLFP